MDKRIIYQNNEGGISIVVPTPEALTTMTIEEIQAIAKQGKSLAGTKLLGKSSKGTAAIIHTPIDRF